MTPKRDEVAVGPSTAFVVYYRLYASTVRQVNATQSFVVVSIRLYR